MQYFRRQKSTKRINDDIKILQKIILRIFRQESHNKEDYEGHDREEYGSSHNEEEYGGHDREEYGSSHNEEEYGGHDREEYGSGHSMRYSAPGFLRKSNLYG